MPRRSPPRPVGRINTAASTTTSEQHTEQTPLLAGTPTPVSSTARSSSPSPSRSSFTEDGGSGAGSDTLAPLRAALRPRVLLLSLALVFLLELSIGMAVAPTNAIMEAIICRQMHPEAFTPPSGGFLTGGLMRDVSRGRMVLSNDKVCQEPDVQGYLAVLRGWMATFECVPGIVGAVPFGVLSDRWGRRPVLGMSVGGLVAGTVFTYWVFYFSDLVPLWVSWFSAAFQLFGGGGAIVVAMFYTAIADVVPVEGRSTAFFQLGAAFLGSQMVAGPLGGAMLVWNPWVPLLASLAILVITNLAVIIFPETVHVHDGSKAAEAEPDPESDADANVSWLTKLWRKAGPGLAEVWDFVLGNTQLAFLMVSLVFVILGRFVGELLLQYARARYEWSWSKGSMVLTIRNAGSLATLLALLPAAGAFCDRRLGMTGVEKDLWLARWSGVVHIVGSLIIAGAVNGALFSVGLAWFALGSGMSALIRSMLNALVEEHHVGTVNSLIGFMEMVGMTMAGPLLAESLKAGLYLGGAWIGLPFVVATVLFVVSTTILWTFRLPQGASAVEI
ncbi:major facilitator superfamily domain-containing protein [Staphylotrichum tortipilum]|uniref:Major facilitator superfamily domain-containing protein n=1 Tax=Staphylotrichum tortipilum TaxID=2831512 RepID=A0AAN6RPV5_9PEZI|nr:major facilitator superfamily domain-containing protein [Staphylotrichum longicolle]